MNGSARDSKRKVYDRVWHWIVKQTYETADSPASTVGRQVKSNEADDYHPNLKAPRSPKHPPIELGDPARSNIYAQTPPKLKPSMHAREQLAARHQRLSAPVRTDSARSAGSTTLSSMSSRSTTPSNSFRHDPRTLASTAATLNTELNEHSGKTIYDIESAILYNNQKCLNMITGGYSSALQSVKEDECLHVDANNNPTRRKFTKNDSEQQRVLMDILRSKSPSSTSSTPVMPRTHPAHQRSSSTNPADDQLPAENINSVVRNQRIRSSLPFIVKPPANGSKCHSLGLCFLICGNETRKVLLPAHVSCLDTLKALFVRAFPQYLTMKQMDTEQIRIYIRESDKDIFYQLEDVKDVKDRSILKIVQLNGNVKQHVSFKEPEVDETAINGSTTTTYQRFSRLARSPASHGHTDDRFTDLSPRSRSEPRRETTPNGLTTPTTTLKSILASPRSGSTTPRIDDDADDDARAKIPMMERQLESLTELVRQLTAPTKSKILHDFHNQSFHQQLFDLKIKTHTLRQDLMSIRRMQQSLQENFQSELKRANRKIQEQVLQSERYRCVEGELSLYLHNRMRIDRDLEDLEISVEELQNDVKWKQCYVTINDVESFAFILSTISRSLVDLKASFPVLQQKLSPFDHPTAIKFLREEPERLDYTIKKCKRLTTMLYQLKRLVVNEGNKPMRKVTFHINEKLVDRPRLLEEIQSVTLNSDGRLKAIEKAEKLRQRRLFYEHQLENLKHTKSFADHPDGCFDNRSLSNSVSTRTSICSTDSNHCPSPSLSYVVRQALTNLPSTNHGKTHLQSSFKSPSKVTFSQHLTSNDRSTCANKKQLKPNPPPRMQSTPSSSAVSSASSSSSSCAGGNSRFCGIIPLIAVDRRPNGRCYSFSSSSTDTDSVISNSQNLRLHPSTLMRTSVTDL